MKPIRPEDLFNLLKENYAAHGRALTPGIVEGYWLPALEDYPLEAIALAFLESYKQILVSAKLSGLRPKIWYSAPDSGDFEAKKRLRIQKTLEAVTLGMIGQDRANETITAVCGEIGQDPAHYLPHLKPNLQLVNKSNQKKIMQDIMKVLK